MKRAAIAIFVCAAAFAASPAHACFLLSSCDDQAVYVAPYEADLPPPQILELVKRREDGGLSLAGFYNVPSLSRSYEPADSAAGYDEPERHSPHVIYSPWGHSPRRHERAREAYHSAHFHAHIRHD